MLGEVDLGLGARCLTRRRLYSYEPIGVGYWISDDLQLKELAMLCRLGVPQRIVPPASTN